MQRLRSILNHKPVVTYPKRFEHTVHVVVDPNSPTGLKGLPKDLEIELRKGVLINGSEEAFHFEKEGSTISSSNSEFPVVPSLISPSRRLSIPPRDPIYIEGVDPMDRFREMKKIGHGSCGVVFTAVDSRGRRVALKRAKPRHNEAQILLDMEIRMMSCTRHTNLVKSYETYVFKGYSWIVMEMMDGGSLANYLHLKEMDGVRLLETEIAFVIREILRGLAFMHGLRRLHRDLKGANVLLSLDGKRVKLADFGFCVELSREQPNRTTMVGTPCWMAPEVISKHAYDYKADVWSVGIIAIECAQFVPPYATAHPVHALAKIAVLGAPTLSDPSGVWSPTFHNFVSTLLVKDPRRRPTVAECLDHPFLRKCANSLS